MNNVEKRNGFGAGAGAGAGAGFPLTHGNVTALPGSGGSRGKRSSVGSQTDHGPTTTKPFMSPNITPRSRARKARAESTSPTSHSTPNDRKSGPRPLSSVEKRHVNGSSNRPVSGDAYKSPLSPRPHRSGSMSSEDYGDSFTLRSPHERRDTAMSAPATQDSKSFHVSGALPSRPLKRTALDKSAKPWTGDQINTDNFPSGRSSALSNNSPTHDEQRPKFFYANDVAEAKAPASRNSSNNATTRPILPTIHSGHTTQTPNTFRPPSPLKEEILHWPQYNVVSSPQVSSNLSSARETKSYPVDDAKAISSLSRTSSIASPPSNRTASHGRKSSIHSNNASRARKSSINQPIGDRDESARSSSLPRPHPFSPDSQVSSRPTTPNETPQSRATMSQPQSPKKPQSELDRMNELAANARRERKVLDLEISNSSLLAINQTLEREMRKMKSELRHYRRLSRSGRLSSSQIPVSTGRKSCPISPLGKKFDSDDLLSDSDAHEEDDEGPSHFFQKSSLNNRAALVRFNDPKVEPPDLHAHHNMLLEGQKLNLSIKRCLGSSEKLLMGAKHALELQAESFDVEKLGPRVLTPAELEDDVVERRQGLLTPSVSTTTFNPWERSLTDFASLSTQVEELNEAIPVTAVDEMPAASIEASLDNLAGSGVDDDIDEEAPEDTQDEQTTSEHAEGERTSPIPSNVAAPPSKFPDLNGYLQHPNDQLADSAHTPPRPDAKTLATLTGTSTPSTRPPSAPSQPERESVTPQSQTESETQGEVEADFKKPDPDPSASSSQTMNEAANTPGNRSSITKYLSSFWSGASSLRPP